MDQKLETQVRERLAKNESPARIRNALIDSGFSEHEVDEALRNEVGAHLDRRDKSDKRNSRILTTREIIDRIGYGAVAPQFINILFFMTGANLFLLGLFNGLKTVFSMFLTSILQEYSKRHRVSKNTISMAGVVFGFSFLLMAAALRLKIVWLFAAGILLAGVGVVTYGDLYTKLVVETIRREKMGAVLRRMGQYGILITMLAMILGGWIIDKWPETSKFTFTLFGMEFQLLGYVLTFLLTAIAFIISGHMLSYLKEKREARTYKLGRFIIEHCSALKGHAKVFFKNKYISLMIVATVITGLLEVLGHSYYGLFIYQQFKHDLFGGFMNIAILYSFAILASFLGPWFTKKVQKSIGLAPMLVFGTLLIAILPLTLAFNAYYWAIAVALVFSVIGGAIVGVAQGLLARKLMDEQTRKQYFMSLGLIVAIPYLVLFPLGSWFTELFGMQMLFFVIGLGLAVVVMPIYFILVAMANKERL